MRAILQETEELFNAKGFEKASDEVIIKRLSDIFRLNFFIPLTELKDSDISDEIIRISHP